jgi:hypothetical protein
MPVPLLWLRSIGGTCVAHGAHHTPTYPAWTFKRLPHRATNVCTPVQHKFVWSACNQHVTACFTSTSVKNWWPARCFLRGPQRRQSLGVIRLTGLVTGYGATPGSSRTTVPTKPIFLPLIFVSEPLKKHLDKKQLAADADVKQAVTSWL